jgi:phage terminase small subunit
MNPPQSTSRLLPKQRLFAQLAMSGWFLDREHILARDAYIRAGYRARGKSASAAASRLLRNPAVAAYCDELKNEAQAGRKAR